MTRSDKIDFIRGVLSGEKAAIERKTELQIKSMTYEEIKAKIEEYESQLYDPDIEYSKLNTDEKIEVMKLLVKYEAGFVRDLDNKPLQSAERKFITSIRNKFNG